MIEDRMLKKIIFIMSILSVQICLVHAQENASTCITCHAELDGPLSTAVEQIKESVHNHAQLSCVGCHGGDATEEDPELSMAKSKGFVGKPSPADVPKLCAKCHSDITFMRGFDPNFPVGQYDLYRTSRHGQLLAKGDIKVATCTSCHGIHDIRRSDDPTSLAYPLNIAENCAKCHSDADYMSEYDIDTDQLAEYKTSYHAKILYENGDISAPTCNDCHGNHGAIPPGVSSISNVCGTCHYNQSEYFSTSPHKMAFDDMGFSECEACHGNHGIQQAGDNLLGVEGPAICSQCHDTDSEGYNVAIQLKTYVDSLSTNITLAEEMLNKAQIAGVEVRDEELSLPNAKDALIHVRTLVHTFSIEKVKERTEEGLSDASKALIIGEEALEEVGHRRMFFVVMVLLTMLVATLLVLYIKYSEQDSH
jgi:predicted CXXCH cytochrome family protein